jgi:hypothetical protein
MALFPVLILVYRPSVPRSLHLAVLNPRSPAQWTSVKRKVSDPDLSKALVIRSR